MISSRPRRRAGAFALGITLAAFGSPLAANAAGGATVSINRVAGANRYATAAAAARAAHSVAARVLLASGTVPADALAGSYLAGISQAPILLTTRDQTPAETAAALRDLQVREVTILGGSAAVSDAQAQALASTPSTSPQGGVLNVTRVAGADRYATANQIDVNPGPGAVGQIGGQPTALVASGAGFADALAGGSLAAGAHLPIVLSTPSELAAAARDTLSSLGIRRVYILGGTAAVATAVQDQINAMGITTSRLAGAGRTDTALAIAGFAGAEAGFTTSSNCGATGTEPRCAFPAVAIARGDDGGGGIDALALGPLGGIRKEPVLLSLSPDDPSTATVAELNRSAAPGVLTQVDIAGGTVALSAAEEQFVATAVGNGPRPTFSISPSSVPPGGQVTVDAHANPCPAPPAGSGVFSVLVIDPGTGPGQRTVLAKRLPAGGGDFSGALTIPSTTPPGSYGVIAECSVDFAPDDPALYSYAIYAPTTLTVS